MNNPLQRNMFREAGMSKQPMGILASSPELMGAVKGYEKGGTYQDRVIREAQKNAPEFSTLGIATAIPEIPIYGNPKLKIFNSPGENLGLGEIGTSKIGDTLKDEVLHNISVTLFICGSGFTLIVTVNGVPGQSSLVNSTL